VYHHGSLERIKRMKTPRSIVLLPLLAVTLLACAAGRMALREGERIVFFGDSITELGVKPNGYVTLIREAIMARHPNTLIEVIGAGVSGNKVPDLQQRLVRDVMNRKPAIVVIYIGINDVWHWELKNLKGTTKEDYESGLREMIARMQYAGANVILCTPSVIGEKTDSSNGQDTMLEEYAAISRAVARSLGTTLCDLRKAFHDYLVLNNKENKRQGILTYDGVHLNDEGNKLVAREILKYLE
jgi:lysophospholipase L1-like esterase